MHIIYMQHMHVTDQSTIQLLTSWNLNFAWRSSENMSAVLWRLLETFGELWRHLKTCSNFIMTWSSFWRQNSRNKFDCIRISGLLHENFNEHPSFGWQRLIKHKLGQKWLHNFTCRYGVFVKFWRTFSHPNIEWPDVNTTNISSRTYFSIAC